MVDHKDVMVKTGRREVTTKRAERKAQQLSNDWTVGVVPNERDLISIIHRIRTIVRRLNIDVIELVH